MNSSDVSDGDESDCDELNSTPPEIQEAAATVVRDLMPQKSKEKYLKAYETFLEWKNERKSKSLSENVFIAYFSELSKRAKPSTLWAIYSMLKCTILMKHNLNLKNYKTLTAMLKKQSDGYITKKSKVLTASDVKTFLNEAPDREFLVIKVFFN